LNPVNFTLAVSAANRRNPLVFLRSQKTV